MHLPNRSYMSTIDDFPGLKRNMNVFDDPTATHDDTYFREIEQIVAQQRDLTGESKRC